MGVVPINAAVRTATKADRIQVDFMNSPLMTINFFGAESVPVCGNYIAALAYLTP
jgi:hypothetical protein